MRVDASATSNSEAAAKARRDKGEVRLAGIKARLGMR
jgi:hypothetical protein